MSIIRLNSLGLSLTSKLCVSLQSEFTELASNLSDYVVKLLDKVQGNEELNVILNNSDGLKHTPNKTLARLQLAIDYKEKKVSAARGGPILTHRNSPHLF